MWGIVALGRNLFPPRRPQNQFYQPCEKWLLEKIASSQETITLDLEDIELFIRWFSENLHAKRGKLYDTLFGKGKIQLGKLYLENYCRESNLELRLEKNASFNSRYSSGKDYVRFPLSSTKPDASEVYRMAQYFTWKIVIDDLGAPLYPPQNALSTVPSGETLYLLAARTGFTLMRKMLASAAFTMGGEAMPLLLPARRFMQRFLNLSFEEKSRYADFADMLESRVLLGQVRWNDAPLPDYSYFPMKNPDVRLPLWLTSSLVKKPSPPKRYRPFILRGKFPGRG